MIDRYDFRFFKFDGISAQASAIGPDEGTRGEENAEAIISIERAVRQKRPDIFLNTTVGTWASPFWFHFTDAVWRQEGDYGEAGDQGTTVSAGLPIATVWFTRTSYRDLRFALSTH